MEKSINLIVKPKWNDVEEVRNKSTDFLRSNGFSKDGTEAITMVISELIENGIKYGSFASEDNVTANIHIGDKILTVEVIHPVDETTYVHLRNLDKTIQWIRGFQDPFEAFIERLKEVSKKPLGDEESGFGLVRIAYEGKAILDFFVNEDNILNVSAVSNF